MITFLHGTSTKSLDAIRAQGLVPAAGQGGVAWAQKNRFGAFPLIDVLPERRGVYLTTGPRWAREFSGYAADIQGGEPAVVLVQLPGSALKKLDIDSHLCEAASDCYGASFIYHGVIKPEWIKGEVRGATAVKELVSQAAAQAFHNFLRSLSHAQPARREPRNSTRAHAATRRVPASGKQGGVTPA